MQKPKRLIINGEWNHFLTLPDEKLLCVTRKHWFLLIAPLSFIILIGIVSIVFAFIIFSFFLASIKLFVSGSLVLLISSICLAAKVYVDWYFHLYIVTSRKILEIQYAPLSTHMINDVLLDQVNCTEIDVKTDGIICELLDMGNIIITFDRPTHQQEFMLLDIQNPKEISSFLSQNLVMMNNRAQYMPIWYKTGNNQNSQNNYRFIEEIFPGSAVRGEQMTMKGNYV